jgi:hypothetical protein
MRKLQLDDIRVESFVTADTPPQRGTVRGRENGEEAATAALSCTCKSEITWIGPPAECCAFAD